MSGTGSDRADGSFVMDMEHPGGWCPVGPACTALFAFLKTPQMFGEFIIDEKGESSLQLRAQVTDEPVEIIPGFLFLSGRGDADSGPAFYIDFSFPEDRCRSSHTTSEEEYRNTFYECEQGTDGVFPATPSFKGDICLNLGMRSPVCITVIASVNIYGTMLVFGYARTILTASHQSWKLNHTNRIPPILWMLDPFGRLRSHSEGHPFE